MQPSAAAEALAVAPARMRDPERVRRAHAYAARRAQLERLSEVEAGLFRARRALAALDEARALRELAVCERTLSQTLMLPGASVFYAEVQLLLGVSAAQLGRQELAEAAFMRAARVDPSRRLLLGEAAPEVVALAQRAFESASRAAYGEVYLTTTPEAARVFVDDVELGAAPLWLRVQSGSHVLRVEAAGYAPYAGMFDVVAGKRPEQRLVLSELPIEAALGAATRGRQSAAELETSARALLAVAPELSAVVFAELPPGAAGRAFFVSCSRLGCRAPIVRDARNMNRAPAPHASLSAANLRSARAWLSAEAPVRTEVPAPSRMLWQRWYVWVALSAAALGGAIAIGVAATPEPERRLRVDIDASALH